MNVLRNLNLICKFKFVNLKYFGCFSVFYSQLVLLDLLVTIRYYSLRKFNFNNTFIFSLLTRHILFIVRPELLLKSIQPQHNKVNPFWWNQIQYIRLYSGQITLTIHWPCQWLITKCQVTLRVYFISRLDMRKRLTANNGQRLIVSK